MKKQSKSKPKNNAASRRPRERYNLDFDISYKNYEQLGRFINDRARIIGRTRTGLSPKQQRLLTREVKRARHLGLLPFKAQI